MENICTIRQIQRTTRQAARCRADAAQPFKKRTIRNHGNGFLTHSFRPFWAFEGNRVGAEREFFRSLENICTYYDLRIPDVKAFSFPQNIYRAWEITSERITAIDKNLDCIILKDEQHTATLATIRQFNTGHTLYYIPVKPLWKWVRQAKNQDLAEVVIGIFAYLQQVVQVPFFTEPDSYVQQQYSFLDEMLREDMENEKDEDAYRQEQLDEIFTLQNAGQHLYRKISDPQQLIEMEAIVLNYSQIENCHKDWAILAIEFVQLYHNYPERTYFDNIRPDLFHPEIEERIYADQYISFYWSGNDCLQDSIFEMINCDFQEKGVTDEPIAIELFDTLTEKKSDNFGFETRLFALLNRLCELLNKYDHD